MMIWASVGALALLVAGVVIFAGGSEHGSAPAWAPASNSGDTRLDVMPVARRETRPTLDPAGFSGQAALAYQVAREIPEVLDQLECYCACEQYGHVSLLSCYTDGHGAT
jgi:hypothetical protein